MQATDDRLSNVFKSMQWNHELITNLSLQLNETYQLNELQNIIQISFMKMRLYTGHLLGVYNKLLSRCNELIEGCLPEILIPFDVLAQTIKDVKNNVWKHNYKILSTDLLFYYQYGQFQFYWFDNKLYITIKFPMITENSELNLYEILSYPIPINSSTTHASKVSNVPKYLAITKNKDYYAELNCSALNTCKDLQSRFHCPYDIALTPNDLQEMCNQFL